LWRKQSFTWRESNELYHCTTGIRADGAPATAGVQHIAITVTDLNRSVPWYTDLFGLKQVMDEPHEGGRGVILMDPRSGLFIGLHAHDANGGEPFAETRTGLDHVCFGVASRELLVAWQERLEMGNMVRSPIADMHYGSVLVFRDPDSVQLELIAPPAHVGHQGGC